MASFIFVVAGSIAVLISLYMGHKFQGAGDNMSATGFYAAAGFVAISIVVLVLGIIARA